MATLKTRLKARMGRGEGKGLGWTGHRRVALPGEFRGWLRWAVGVRTGEVVVAQKGNVVCCDKRGGEKISKYMQGVTVYSWGRISLGIPALC